MDYDTKKHIIDCLDKGVRYDGRKKDQLRDIEIKTGVIETAEGSAHVKCGNTEVIAGVKMTVEKPFSDTPDEGILMVGAELYPLSNPKYESGPPDNKAIEVARVIDKGIRESKGLDNKRLCIRAGEKVWTINVDIAPLNDDGNLIDVGSIAALAAIKNAKFPKYENDKVDYKVKTDESLPYNKEPIAITVIKLGNHYIIDPTELEQDAIDARLTVISTEDGNLCALQKGGDWPLSVEDVDNMIELAILKAGEIRKLINKS